MAHSVVRRDATIMVAIGPRADNRVREGRIGSQRMTQSGHPPVTIGILSVTPAQIVFRRHPQMLNEELHCWANAAVP